MRNTWDKFKHRNVVKIATAYAVVGWVMLQVIEVVLPTFNAPEWIAQTLVFTVITVSYTHLTLPTIYSV